MNRTTIEHQRIAAEGAVSIADDFLIKLTENEKIIVESRIKTEITAQLASSVNDVLRRVVLELSQEPVEKSISTLQTLISWLDERAEKSKIDTSRIEGVQEGMRRALDAVKQTGTFRVAEAQRIIDLSQESQDNSRRNVGDRPEKLSTKRKAAEIKAEQDI